MKKGIGLLLSAAMAVGTLAGVGTTDVQAADKTLRFMDISPSEARQKYYEGVFAKFEEETGIAVAYESVPWDDAANKYTVLGASGQLPDVMTVWAGWLGQYTQAGWVVPLDEYLEGKRDTYTDAVNKLLWKSEENRYGHLYTVPDGLMVKGVYYRKDWAEEAGLNLDPTKGWTYDEYFDAVRAMTNKDEKHYGTSYRGARGAFDPILVYMQNFTGGNTYDTEGNILINSDECVEALKTWTSIYLEGYAPEDAINWGFTEMVDNFTGGLTATLINDSEVLPTCAANMTDDQWGVMPMPYSPKDGGLYNTINAPYAYSISGNSEMPDESWQLIEFLTNAENNIEYCKMSGQLPIKKDVENDDTYGLEGPYAPFVQQMNDPKLAVPGTFGPFDFTDLHQGMFHEEIQKYLLGDQDAETALNVICDELQARMTAYLEENPDSIVEQALTLQ